MTTADHRRHEEDLGAYLLGALTDVERQAFEQHLARCELCQQDLEHLRVAAEALPRSVEPYEAPDSLKESLIATVRAEAPEAEPKPRRERPSLGQLRLTFPRLAWGAAAALLATVLVAVGFYQLGRGSDETERTITAQADAARVPQASGRLVVDDDDQGAILEVNGVRPAPGRRVLHVWVKRGDQVVRSSMFEVADGRGFAAVPEDLDDVDLVMVTRERRPVPAPTEAPILTFDVRA
jgi:anti-sigma factor RsiW